MWHGMLKIRPSGRTKCNRETGDQQIVIKWDDGTVLSCISGDHSETPLPNHSNYAWSTSCYNLSLTWPCRFRRGMSKSFSLAACPDIAGWSSEDACSCWSQCLPCCTGGMWSGWRTIASDVAFGRVVDMILVWAGMGRKQDRTYRMKENTVIYCNDHRM